MRPPWAGPGDIPESTGVARCLLAACPGPAMGLTDRPAPALTSATARGPRSQLGAAEDGSTLGIATSSTERTARGGQREGAAEPEAMAGDADCPVHGGEGTGRPTPSALPRTLCRQLCSGVSLPYSQNLPQPARSPAQCPSEVPQTSPGGGNPKTKSDAGWCEVRGNRPGMGSPPRAEVRGGHEPGQVCPAGSRDVRPPPQGMCLGPFSAQAPETRWTSSPRTCMLRGLCCLSGIPARGGACSRPSRGACGVLGSRHGGIGGSGPCTLPQCPLWGWLWVPGPGDECDPCSASRGPRSCVCVCVGQRQAPDGHSEKDTQAPGERCPPELPSGGASV